MDANMKKYDVIAYADEEGNKRQEAVVEAANRMEAESKAWRMFPAHHEIGVYEREEN